MISQQTVLFSCMVKKWFHWGLNIILYCFLPYPDGETQSDKDNNGTEHKNLMNPQLREESHNA